MIRLDKSDGLWTVTIDRPDKANSLTEAMLTDLADIAESADEARALVLTGEGKVFSAGADLEAAKAGLATSSAWERLSSAITGLRGLTIAALNGTVAGGAMGMVLACDLRVAVPTAKAFYPVMKLGFLPQPNLYDMSSYKDFLFQLALFAMGLALLFSGGGMLSLDRWIFGKSVADDED